MSASKAPHATSRVIIEAIDALRNRKARPDETRISHWIERRYGMKKDQVTEMLQSSVADGSVLRVKYKDSISYRNPAKFTRFVHSHVSKFSAPLNVTKRILRGLRQLTRTDASQKEGASVGAILQALHQNKQLLNYNEAHLERILKRASGQGTVLTLPNGNYLLAGAKRIIARKPAGSQTQTAAQAASSKSNDGGSTIETSMVTVKQEKKAATAGSEAMAAKRRESEASMPNSEAPQQRKRKNAAPVVTAKPRARPISKRKKFKKSLGPDFLEPSDLGLQYLQDSFHPKCDFCQLTNTSNPQGSPEELLICKDCDAKAHPSCMQYTEELAIRSRLAPWQCIDCKACHNCLDSGDWDFMLFCDLCDKGYHMSCHIPPLDHKPNGKWVCTDCLKNERKRAIKREVCDDGEDESTRGDDKASTSTGITDIGEASSFNDVMAKKIVNCPEKNILRHLLPHPKDILEIYPNMTANPREWTVDDVATFVNFIGFPDQSIIFKDQEIDGISLLLLKRMDVLTGLSMKLGPALKIFGHVQRLQNIHTQN